MNWQQELQRAFDDVKSYANIDSKYEFVSGYIFGFTTYDEGMDEIIVNDMCAVIEFILDRTDYINDAENYKTYILMVNTMFLKKQITWGTSIRGAWIDDVGNKEDVYDGDLKVLQKDRKEFLRAVVEFVKPSA